MWGTNIWGAWTDGANPYKRRGIRVTVSGCFKFLNQLDGLLDRVLRPKKPGRPRERAGERVELRSLSVGFPLVFQAMADAGYDHFYGVGILNWVRVTNATMTHNCHGYSMGQTTPLIISGTNGSLRYRDESGYSLVYPPASGGVYFDVLHSGKHPQIFHDGFFYRIGQQAEKRDASGVYSRILSSDFVTILTNWQQ